MVQLLARTGSKRGVVTPLTRRLVEISRPGGCRVMSKAHAQRRQRLVRRAGLRTPGSQPGSPFIKRGASMNEDQVASHTDREANAWSKPPGGGADQPKASKGRKAVLYVAGLALTVAGIGFAGSAMQGIDWRGEAGRKQEADDAFRARVETDVKRLLRDPLSATFQNMFYWTDTAAACGEVNSKNGFGGFAGFDRFAYHDGRIAFYDKDADAYFRLMRACQRARVLSAKHDVQDKMATIEASSMTDVEKRQAKIESERSLSDLENQMAVMANEAL